jgi:hypothetical protein
MMLGHKNSRSKVLGSKVNIPLSLGNKNAFGNINSIKANNGHGLSTNHVMPSGHAPFKPIGLK